ncbi:MAG: ORF6N domain-containing protein [Treponema sp.]|nr:ORF6N domain-containing protein [Treponema sp.]
MANQLAKIQKRIYAIRGQRVMLDNDLAMLYEVETSNLNKAVKRNIKRFPSDFMFQLTKAEWENLIFQNGISSNQHGGRRFMPFAFTEQGVAMLASVINSQKAINVNIQIMRAFVKLRHYVLSKSDEFNKISELHRLLMLHIENTDNKFSKHEKTIKQILYALNSLIEQPPKTKRIGFGAD